MNFITSFKDEIHKLATWDYSPEELEKVKARQALVLKIRNKRAVQNAEYHKALHIASSWDKVNREDAAIGGRVMSKGIMRGSDGNYKYVYKSQKNGIGSVFKARPKDWRVNSASVGVPNFTKKLKEKSKKAEIEKTALGSKFLRHVADVADARVSKIDARRKQLYAARDTIGEETLYAGDRFLPDLQKDVIKEHLDLGKSSRYMSGRATEFRRVSDIKKIREDIGGMDNLMSKDPKYPMRSKKEQKRLDDIAKNKAQSKANYLSRFNNR